MVDSRPKVARLISVAVFAAVFAACLVIGQRMMNADGDLGRHLVVGEYILRQQQIPLVDYFSHSLAGAPFTPHEWLAEVLFALAFRVKGFAGVVWLAAFILAAAYSLFSRVLLQLSQKFWLVIGMTVAAMGAGSLHFLTRPHIFSYLLFVILLVLLRIDKRPVIVRGLMIAVFIVWANTHGGFLYGLLYLGGRFVPAFITGVRRGKNSAWKFELIDLGLAVSGTLVNPAGWKVYQTAFGFLSSSYLVQHTQEYLPIGLDSLYGWLFLSLNVIVLLVFAMKTRQAQLLDYLQAITWSGMGWLSARHIPIAVMVLLSTIAGLLSRNDPAAMIERDSLENQQDRKVRQPAAIYITDKILIVLAIIAGYFYTIRANYSFDPAAFPVQAAQAIREKLPAGNMFNEFTWGGYLLFELRPEQKVFIDGQTDFYGEGVAKDYVTIRQAEDGWQMLMEKYAVDWVILPPEAPLVGILQGDSKNWRTVYQDEVAVVLNRIKAP